MNLRALCQPAALSPGRMEPSDCHRFERGWEGMATTTGVSRCTIANDIKEIPAMKHAVNIFAVGMLGLLAACGTQPKERTTGGAAAGAATGAAVGALAGPPGMAVGALVGGGAGAVTGASTTPDQVNLGKPPWNNPNTRVPGTTTSSGTGSR